MPSQTNGASYLYRLFLNVQTINYMYLNERTRVKGGKPLFNKPISKTAKYCRKEQLPDFSAPCMEYSFHVVVLAKSS